MITAFHGAPFDIKLYIPFKQERRQTIYVAIEDSLAKQTVIKLSEVKIKGRKFKI